MKTVAFICVHNACRSQMAEGWAKVLGKGIVQVYSAGTEKRDAVHPLAAAAMKEAGIDISRQYPKLIGEIPPKVDILITMGCRVACPFISHDRYEDWQLDDPSGGTLETFRKSRDFIREKVIRLIESIQAENRR